MKKINILYYVLCVLLMSSCYEDYAKDYDYSTTYFASQRPLRTVIADRNMQIRVGVAIGGKRDVDMNDWVEFEIDRLYWLEQGWKFFQKNIIHCRK